MTDFPRPAARMHGGPDALGMPAHDFSTNANACGPCPEALAAVQAADAARYPDAGYTALRARLAAFHGVEPGRVVMAGSASECIFRITAWVARQGGARVWLPDHAYGDYADAAAAWGGARAAQPADADLAWACEPSSPIGGTEPAYARWARAAAVKVLDCAYAPLRLEGAAPAVPADAWQLWTPNKALGLTGVRAAYAIAPQGQGGAADALRALAPSWPVGAHGVALLQAWTAPAAQDWLAASRATLRGWKDRQALMLQTHGWGLLPGAANFVCARPPQPLAALLPALRARGIKLRDCASFALPGHVRLGVLAPASQHALDEALRAQVKD
ncbi:aminotransferase class I/II-fold pyridoxal phosphate-dependent enzyme [Xylophilus sp.]|uniref:aminotransferase class I/II-fold pyridoxal phosphate-dependent enzyme n=1 Tax=Xylophilus sp. TaxID=2653893 RepID=UPI002D810FDD|nr:aminotransferase class I/II-fold pyridoxal phosphate-dependent enzyme [Xylophilus sp.]